MKKSGANRWLVAGFFLVIFITFGVLFFVSDFSNQLPERIVVPVALEATDLSDIQKNQSMQSTVMEKTILHGSVLDEEDRGYRDAWISLVRKEDRSSLSTSRILTDPYGRFELSVPHGAYILFASADDAIQEVTQEMVVSGDESHCILHLSRSKTLQGIVVDEFDGPVSQAQISILGSLLPNRFQAMAGRISQSLLSYSTVSRQDGQFEIHRIWPGWYNLICEATGYLSHVEDHVQAGQELRIVLCKQSVVQVRVSDGRGEPVFLARVDLKKMGAESTVLVSEETNSEGFCVFSKIDAGMYFLDCSHPQYDHDATSQQTIEVRRDRESVSLILKNREFAISGRVLTVDEKKPVSNFTIYLTSTSSILNPDVNLTTQTNENGEFVYHDVSPGRYQFRDRYADNPDSPYRMQSLNPAYVSVVDSDVQDVEVFVHPANKISGTVFDEEKQPVEGAQVSVDRTGNVKLTDSKGNYESSFFPYMNKEKVDHNCVVIAYHPEKGYGQTSFIVDMGEYKKDVDVYLHPGVDVIGKISDTDNTPLSGARVELGYFGFPSRWVASNQHGDYRLENVHPKKSRLKVEADGYQTEERDLDDSLPSETLREDFVLIRNGEEEIGVSGRVVDRNASPMSDVLVSLHHATAKDPFPFGAESTETDSDGSFQFSNVKSDFIYRLRAESNGVPQLVKDFFGIRKGMIDLVLTLDFEPVEVSIVFDQDSQGEWTKNRYPFLTQLIDVQNPSHSSEERLLYSTGGDDARPFMVTEPGFYAISMACGAKFYGMQTFTIDDQTPKHLDIHVKIQSSEEDSLLLVLGRCVNPDGSVVEEPYRVMCRQVNAGDVAQLQELSAPNREEGVFSFVVFQGGVFEVLYRLQSGPIFHRFIVELKREMDSVVQYEGVPCVRLPDVVFPIQEEN